MNAMRIPPQQLWTVPMRIPPQQLWFVAVYPCGRICDPVPVTDASEALRLAEAFTWDPAEARAAAGETRPMVGGYSKLDDEPMLGAWWVVPDDTAEGAAGQVERRLIRPKPATYYGPGCDLSDLERLHELIRAGLAP